MDVRPAKTLKLIFIAALILMGAAFLASVCVGKYPIALSDIANMLTGQNLVSDMTRRVFFTLRLPRTIMALLAGFGLGLAGSVYQTIFNNPLAAPDVIGVASGANLGAAAAIMLVGSATAAVAGGAFLGGIVAVLLVILLVRATGANSTATYVLAGIILSAVAQAVIMILKFFADAENELAAMVFWSMGSFGGVTDAKLMSVFPIYLVGIIGLILLRRQVFLLSLNEDEAKMLGVRVRRMRVAILGFSTLTVASVISVTGLISFVGLIAPHIARLSTRRSTFAVSVLAGLIGSVILLISDSLARILTTAELPISILTTFIGVPFLILFMFKRRKGRRL